MKFDDFPGPGPKFHDFQAWNPNYQIPWLSRFSRTGTNPVIINMVLVIWSFQTSWFYLRWPIKRQGETLRKLFPGTQYWPHYAVWVTHPHNCWCLLRTENQLLVLFEDVGCWNNCFNWQADVRQYDVISCFALFLPTRSLMAPLEVIMG